MATPQFKFSKEFANVVADDILEDRPDRLGLGASYIPHREAVQLDKTLQKRVKKANSKKRLRNGDDDDVGTIIKRDDEDDEEDSRTATFKNKKQKHSEIDKIFSDTVSRKKKKKKKKKTKQNTDNSNNNDVKLIVPSKKATSNIKNIHKNSIAVDNSSDNNRSKIDSVDSGSSNKDNNSNGKKQGNSKKYMPRSKRKTKYGRRTRSRQKNLKKDTRPIDKRPTYLTKGAADYNPNEPRWKHRGNKDSGDVKAVKLKNGWVMEDKNAAVPSKRKVKHPNNINKIDVRDAKQKESTKVKTKQREKRNEENNMTKDDESFFNDSANQNW